MDSNDRKNEKQTNKPRASGRREEDESDGGDPSDSDELSGDFINDGAYTQRQTPGGGAETQTGMYLRLNALHQEMESPEDFALLHGHGGTSRGGSGGQAIPNVRQLVRAGAISRGIVAKAAAGRAGGAGMGVMNDRYGSVRKSAFLDTPTSAGSCSSYSGSGSTAPRRIQHEQQEQQNAGDEFYDAIDDADDENCPAVERLNYWSAKDVGGMMPPPTGKLNLALNSKLAGSRTGTGTGGSRGGGGGTSANGGQSLSSNNAETCSRDKAAYREAW